MRLVSAATCYQRLKLTQVSRFHEVVVDCGYLASLMVRHAIPAECHHQHIGLIRHGTDPACNFITVQVGQTNIQQYDLRLFRHSSALMPSRTTRTSCPSSRRRAAVLWATSAFSSTTNVRCGDAVPAVATRTSGALDWRPFWQHGKPYNEFTAKVQAVAGSQFAYQRQSQPQSRCAAVE